MLKRRLVLLRPVAPASVSVFNDDDLLVNVGVDRTADDDDDDDYFQSGGDKDLICACAWDFVLKVLR